MSTAYVGEVRCFGFNFAPSGWAACNGQILPIQQYSALFSLLGTAFGGNGTSNFGLPNLQGTVPMHWGAATGLTPTVLGETQGVQSVSLLTSEIPQHTHTATVAVATSTGLSQRVATPTASTWLGGSSVPNAFYASAASSPSVNTAFAPNAIGATGSSQPHENMQPYLTVNFCISLTGVFPTRN